MKTFMVFATRREFVFLDCAMDSVDASHCLHLTNTLIQVPILYIFIFLFYHILKCLKPPVFEGLFSIQQLPNDSFSWS